jgi:hypothetical protein
MYPCTIACNDSALTLASNLIPSPTQSTDHFRRSFLSVTWYGRWRQRKLKVDKPNEGPWEDKEKLLLRLSQYETVPFRQSPESRLLY